MATVTALVHVPRTRPDPTRRLWQLPVFLLGIGVFLGVYKGWLPVGPADPAVAFRKDVAALAAAAEKLPADPADLKPLLNRVAGAEVAYPDQAAAAHFALGSGYVRVAELTADPNEARGYWVLARQHFDAVRQDKLPEADQPRLAYRAAKARAADPPADLPPGEAELLRQLLSRSPSGEDPGEAPRLVAELSLRVAPPDLKRAKEALTGYVADAGLSTPTGSIARAKLRLAEVHRRLGDHDGAKRWLSQIGAGAPPDVLPTAKAQLAQVRMTEHDWVGAAREWEAVRATADLPPGLRAAAAYHLGMCRLLNRPADPADAAAATADAARLFEEAAKADGPEAAAAAVRLADLDLRSPDPAKHRDAAGLLAAAVRGVKSPAEYADGLVPLNEVQATFEFGVQVLAADGAFESAVAVAEAYKAVAVGGRDWEKRAEALAAWGEAVQKAGGNAAAKFTAAANEYAALGELRTTETDKAAQFRRAAELHRRAGNQAASLAALKKILDLPGLGDEVAGPVWAEYADGLMTAGREGEAVKALNQAMRTPGLASMRARYKMARMLIDTREKERVKLGVALLEQVVAVEKVEVAEQGVHEQALVELADEYVRAGNFVEAETRLREQLKLYPIGPKAGLGKLLLGITLIQRSAPQASPRLPEPEKAREEALKLFKKLVAEVDDRKARGQATDLDRWLWTQAGIRVLQTYLMMGLPNDVLTHGGILRGEVGGTVDELIVLNMMYHAFRLQLKDERALEVRAQMQDVFEKLKTKPGAFPGGSKEYTRKYWEESWFTPDPMK